MQKRKPSQSRRKVIRLTSFLYKSSESHGSNLGEKEFIDKVVQRYTQIAQDAILAGFEWIMPIYRTSCFGDKLSDMKALVKLGELKICVYRKIKRDAHYIQPITGKRVYNPRRPNEKNYIAWECKIISNKNYKFIPCTAMKKRLDDILQNTLFEYRLAPRES